MWPLFRRWNWQFYKYVQFNGHSPVNKRTPPPSIALVYVDCNEVSLMPSPPRRFLCSYVAYAMLYSAPKCIPSFVLPGDWRNTIFHCTHSIYMNWGCASISISVIRFVACRSCALPWHTKFIWKFRQWIRICICLCECLGGGRGEATHAAVSGCGTPFLYVCMSSSTDSLRLNRQNSETCN